MEGFLVKDSLTVLTQNGECTIQLCLGDITKLKLKDKVDVILISAFQADYTPSPTSVIGALLRNLQIHVRHLSRDKEEDLRKLYHCWWSKPLPADKPYNRLLCFETKVFGSRRPQELVGDVFRCLVPILNNKDGTVITPLLNTGDQGFDRVVMLEGMVEAAVNWMKAGLPLRMLKIVLYCRGQDDEQLMRIATSEFGSVFKSFEELKERYMMKDLIPKEVTIDFDVYLSFSKLDDKVVDLIRDKLHYNKSDIRIFDSKQAINADSVWQEDIYKVMMHSARVITVLTPNFLQCTSCIEQYNIAMCCSRKAMRNMLAPFYVEESSLPTYMTQVQYVDCRSGVLERIGEACHQIVISLTITLKAEPPMDPSIQYDVFLSYSHTDSERAHHIVETLKHLNPDLRLFFDIQELKTGSAWQRTLYHSIDGTRVMMALISNKYLRSAVCQEEYNLALAKHCSKSASLKLVSLCIEDIHGIAAEFTKIKMVNAKAENFPQAVDTTCEAIVDWLAGREVNSNAKEIFKEDKDGTVSVDTVSENLRRVQFQMQYGNKEMLLRKKVPFPEELPVSLPARPKEDVRDDEASKCDVAFSYAVEDQKYALYLAAVLGKVQGVVVKTAASSDHERLALIDQAKHIVAVLSPHYTDSMEKCEEFNIALSRQRLSNGKILFPVHVHVLPQQPTYFHLVPSYVSAADKVWPELCTLLYRDITMYSLEKHDSAISRPIELAIHEAACQILREIKKQRTSVGPLSNEVTGSPTLLNVKKVQYQVEHAFTKDTDTAEKYLLSLTLTDDEDKTIPNSSNNINTEKHLLSETQSEPAKNKQKDMLQMELDRASTNQPDSCSEEPVLTGSQPTDAGHASGGIPAQEQAVSTGSNQPEKVNSDKSSNGEGSNSNVIRVDGTLRKKGSGSCMVL